MQWKEKKTCLGILGIEHSSKYYKFKYIQYIQTYRGTQIILQQIIYIYLRVKYFFHPSANFSVALVKN